MELPFDVASTSDLEERDLIASSSSQYWDRALVAANGHLNLRPPGASSDLDINDMEGTADSMVRVIHQNSSMQAVVSTAVTRNAMPVLPHPTLQAPTSSPATHVSLGIIENSATPGWSGRGPPTSSPVSPPIPTSPSVSSLIHRSNILRRSPDLGLSPDPLQLMLDPSSSPNREGHNHDAMLDRLTSSSSPLISPIQPSPSADPFLVHASAPTEANQDELTYSMRTRQPRQLKPYAFDRLEYKHQLQHHPDAIVRFAGLRNPVESSPSPAPSNAGESGSDGAAGNLGSERSSNHMLVNMHSKGKKRRRTGAEQHPAMSPATHGEMSRVRPATTPLGRARRRMSGSPTVGIFPRAPSLPDQGGDDADAPIPWYPDAFNDLSSGLGSEVGPSSVVQRPPRASHTPPPRAKRRRRAPRNLPNISPLASPRLPLSHPPSPHASRASEETVSSDTSTEESSSISESTGSSGEVVLLSERSFVMVVDNHSLSPSPKLERSPQKASQKRRLQPSKYPVITDFFDRQSRKSKRTQRKRRTTGGEKGKRPKGTPRRIVANDPVPAEWQKSKGRRRRERPVDLSVFTTVGRRVLSGWQRRNAVTIDAEDVTFHRALEPLANRARQPLSVPIRPPPPRPPPSGDRTTHDKASSTSRVPVPEPDREARQRIVVDFDIPFLLSGKVFSASCYLGRGWLHELLSVLSGTSLSLPPPRCEVDGHELSSVSTALDYTVFLPYACDSFAKVLDDPQVMPHASFVKWNSDMHAVCSLASWISASAEGNDAHLIRTASMEFAGSVIARIDTQAKSLSPSTLCLQWFAIELLDLATAVRARLVAAVSPVVGNDASLDDYSLYPCAAQLWICLIHLGTAHGMTAAAPGIKILQKSFAASEISAQGSLHASEEIWGTLFGLCALSQFSAHGVSTSTIVLLALDRIRLVADPQVDSGLSTRNLRRRDAYVRLVRWHWRLDDDASATIFKSRRFADLRGEIAGFPAFVQENDAHLLAQHASTDSAFSIFLKLIYASAQQMRPPATREEEYLGRIKKLLSLITPVGSVQAQAVSSTSAPRSSLDDIQLSMLYNRFGALALAMRVLPSAENAHYRVSLARRYVDATRATAATRAAIDIALPIAPALEWSSEIARVLLTEFRGAGRSVGGMELVQCVQLLLSGLGDLSRVTKTPARPGGCLFLVLSEAELCEIPTVQALLQGIVDSHLNYALSLQEEQDPHQQSQDEYGQFDLNWDDPRVLAALDSTTSRRPAAVTTIQYTYQSIIECGYAHDFDHLVKAFENNRLQQRMTVNNARVYPPNEFCIHVLHLMCGA
ncbi:Mus7/MMS22 family-domain-containing protein [Lactarius quietus]|nr:Mus7/MMS22 family-domain-containing protein [Lactarius quietus]